MNFAIVLQVITRSFLWNFLFAVDIVAPIFARMVPGNHWVYFVTIIVTIALFFATYLFSTDSLIIDVREICFYDALIQCIGLLLYWQKIPPTAFILPMTAAILLLKYGRLLWPCKSANGEQFAAWPVFGVIGWLAQRNGSLAADRAARPTRQQAWLAYAFILFTVLAGYVMQYLHLVLSKLVLCSIILLLVPVLHPRVQAHLKAQLSRIFNAIQIEADAARRAAEMQEQHNQILATHNRALAAANQELERAKAALEQTIYLKQRAEELASMNNALRDAAHDLQAPLGNVGLRADRLLHAKNQREREMAMGMLQKAVQDMSQALFDTVHEAKVATGLVPPQMSAIAIHDLLESMLDELDDVAASYGLENIDVFPSGEDLMVACDVRLLRRILYNLIRNAIVHGQAGSSILLAVRAKQGGALVQIWDNGPGIAGLQAKDGAENFRALTERIRLQTSQQRTTGHRLGLNNVQQLANVLGLQLTVRSRIGRGTVFGFVLPLADAQLLAEQGNTDDEGDANAFLTNH